MATYPPVRAALSLAAQRDKGKLSSGDPWLLLADVVYQDATHIRLARNVDDVQFDAGDGLGIQTYQKFAFDLQIERSGNGQLPTIQLQASNVMGLLQTEIEAYAGAVGAQVKLYFVNTANPAGEGDIAITSMIMRTECTTDTVTFALGAPRPQQQLFPKFLYRANFCMWVYKSAQCGYTGALPTCDLTFDGANGCKVHNNSTRFGAFPGIGTNGASIASQT
jgi:lambda family phage minor tail protein L